MKENPQLSVYKASAGSGKTFTLAVEYIKLLIQDPKAYRNILAVTFTNKATTEMKERILSQLYGIWMSDKESEAYLNKIKEEVKMTDAEIRKAAGIALHTMIHDYSRFRVETIDSFFQSVMRNLARELELSANLNIELNNEEVLSDAVDTMIEKLERNSPVLYWLIEYIEERINNDKRWNVTNEIKLFGKNIFDEEYIEKGGELRNKLEQKDCIRTYQKEIGGIQTDILEQMKGFADQFFDTLDMHQLTEEDLAGKSKGIVSYFKKLRNGDLSDKTRNATVEKHLADAENWATKTSPTRNQVIDLANQELKPLLTTAEEFRQKNNVLVNSCDLSLHYLNNLKLLTHIDQEVRQLNYEHNRFLLSDTTSLLHNLVGKGDSSFVFEKIGTTIRNVMIDEFQDTSRMQWDNFRLLLLEGLSQGSDSLIVGDVKQSIYRWRNGDWRILNGLQDTIDSFPITQHTLSVNRRSAGNIIEFNNRIFTAICQNLNNLYKAEQHEDCEQLLQAYSDVCQEIGKEPGKGYVKTTFLAPKTEITYQEETLSCMANEIDLLVEKGVKLKDIAILVRKNKTIPIIAEYFDLNTPYRIVSDEAFQLGSSLTISMIIDGLRLLSDPNNSIAKAQLAATYQQDILKRDVDFNTLVLTNLDSFLPPAFLDKQEELRLMPLYELTEKLFSLFDMQKIEQQDAYLCAFFDAVTEYLQNNSSDIDAFIHYWDEKLSEKTIPSGEVEGIRIISIHKAKGLEFHTVLLPFCDWNLVKERTLTHRLWCTPPLAPFNHLDLVPIDYSDKMEQSIYKQDYLDERLQLWVDNLNLLYVALTRPKKNLILWGKIAPKEQTVSQLLQEALGLSSSINTEEKKSQKKKEADSPEVKVEDLVYETGELYLSEKKTQQESTNKLLYPLKELQIEMENLETNIEFKQSNRSADFINGEEDDTKNYIRQGQLLHQVFSQIRTKEDMPQAIARLRFEGLIASDEQEKEVRRITQQALNNPLVQEWYSDQWNLFNECSIIYQEDGKLETRRPDRVMMKDDEVVVIDFKFGKKKKSYNLQVKEYMNLLTDMGHTHVHGYLWYVYTNEIEEIKD